MMKKNSLPERLYNGIIRENPTFVLMLGMCPTLAVTTEARNGLGMGLATAAVLVLSNLLISLLRRVIPGQVRMPAYIVVIATAVTVVELLMHAYVTALYDALGVYIPLIVVNCIIMGRAEAFASKNPPAASAFDGLGMGLGFTLALTTIGAVRELFGAGTLFGAQVMPPWYVPVTILILAPGAFFVLAALAALQNKLKAPSATNVEHPEIACGGDCRTCRGTSCMENHDRIIKRQEEARAAEAARRAEAAGKKETSAPAPSGRGEEGR